MKPPIVFLFAAILFVSAGDALAQPATVQAKKWNGGEIADSDVYFLSSAPRNPGGDFHYRISFFRNEIYNNIIVEQISVRKTEGDTKEVRAVHKYSGFEIGKKLPGVANQLVDLQFVKWTSWNTFVAQEGDKRFRVQLETDGAIQVEREEG